MDEIIIADQKYISSKRAAELTGYAKDYVGQLCREGRVEARLIGRNWYIRESALKDHRFGANQSEKKDILDKDPVLSPDSTWEAPRYDTEPDSPMPVLVQKPEIEQYGPKKEEIAPNMLVDMQAAWQDWFKTIKEPKLEEKIEDALEEPEVIEGVVEDVIVQYEEPAEELEPQIPPVEDEIEEEVPMTIIRSTAPLGRISEHTEASVPMREKIVPVRTESMPLLKVSMVAFAAVLILVTIIGIGIVPQGSGYFGSAAVINTLSGVTKYSK